jgi:Putative lumazine-binding
VNDPDAIEQVVLDYFEGWFEGDAARMERALHPDLAKRSLADDGQSLNVATASEMIDATAQGVGKARDAPDRRIEVDVHEVYGAIANVTVRSAVYREYVQLARTRDGWKIVNTLWQRTERE